MGIKRKDTSGDIIYLGLSPLAALTISSLGAGLYCNGECGKLSSLVHFKIGLNWIQNLHFWTSHTSLTRKKTIAI